MEWKTKLNRIFHNNKSHLIIGLDPDIKKIPNFLFKYKKPVNIFNRLIIDSTKDIVCGYKLNLAFYENYKINGHKLLVDTLKHIPVDLFTICDGKRGDISNSTELYAKTYFDIMGFDAVTASPYMGVDSIEPFLCRKNKLTFILSLTSNKGYSDFQKLICEKQPLFKLIISKFILSKYKRNIGFVFGANHIKEINDFTKKHLEIPLLIPGIGAQKNDLAGLLKSLKNKYFLINSSRNIIYSAKITCTENEFCESISQNATLLSHNIEKIDK
jgi:orotidine-5'-phosphate decarboxylase